MKSLPKTRNENIVVRENGDKVLVYDLIAGKGFDLNETLSIVYKSCDGRTNLNDLKSKDVNLTDQAIFSALDQLRNENLLENDPASTGRVFGNSTRREIVSRLGFASLAALMAGFITGCPRNRNSSIGGFTNTPPSSSSGAPGAVIITFVDSRGGANTTANISTCSSMAVQQCASGKASLACTGPFNNSCACTCA